MASLWLSISNIWGSFSSCSLVSSICGEFIAGLRHQNKAEVLGLLAELTKLTLVLFVPIRLGTTVPLGRFLL
jgi:hypothetical protein